MFSAPQRPDSHRFPRWGKPRPQGRRRRGSRSWEGLLWASRSWSPAHRGSSPGAPPRSPDCCDSHWPLCPALTHAVSWVPALFQSSVWGFFFFMSVYLVSLTNMYTYIFSEVQKCFKLPLSPQALSLYLHLPAGHVLRWPPAPHPHPTTRTRLNTFKKQERRPWSLFLFTTRFP